MIKTCPHGNCDSKDLATSTYSECGTCGRMVCNGLGCTCSDYQAHNPIRLGIGAGVTTRQDDGTFVRSYPYATPDAIAAGKVYAAHRATPWLAPDESTK